MSDKDPEFKTFTFTVMKHTDEAEVLALLNHVMETYTLHWREQNAVAEWFYDRFGGQEP